MSSPCLPDSMRMLCSDNIRLFGEEARRLDMNSWSQLPHNATIFDYMLLKLLRNLTTWKKKPRESQARNMWLQQRGHIWAGFLYCTGQMETVQNGVSTSSGGESWWPIIFLVPNHIDLEDLENLMKLVVATYCPALAWMNARPWTALMSNILWLPEDIALAVSPQIWSTPSRAPSIPIRVPAISHKRKGDEDDDLMSVRSGTSTNVTDCSHTSGTSSGAGSSWVSVGGTSSGAGSSWVPLASSSLGSELVRPTNDRMDGEASESSWSRLSLSDFDADETASTKRMRHRNRWTRHHGGPSAGSSNDPPPPPPLD